MRETEKWKLKKLRYEQEELNTLRVQIMGLLDEIEGNYKAIDQAITDMYPHWVSSQRDEFEKAAQEASAERAQKVGAFRKFFEYGYSQVPIEYWRLESSIDARLNKLLGVLGRGA